MSVVMAGAASAATFGFTFNNIEGLTAGTVSGTITLADGDGTFAATSVIVEDAPVSLGYSLSEEFISSNYPNVVANSFVVANGLITDANFVAINATDGLVLSYDVGANFSFLNVVGSASEGSGVYDGTSRSLEFTQVAPVPLPAGLPLLLVGLGSFGILSRRRKAA